MTSVTADDAILLIAAIEESIFKLDAINILSRSLSSISQADCAEILKSLPPAFRDDPIKILLHANELYCTMASSTTSSTSAVTNPVVTSVLASLRGMSFDEKKNRVLQYMVVADATPEELRDIVACYSFDDGRADALKLIYRHLSQKSKELIRAKSHLIIELFSFADGKEIAARIIFTH